MLKGLHSTQSFFLGFCVTVATVLLLLQAKKKYKSIKGPRPI